MFRSQIALLFLLAASALCEYKLQHHTCNSALKLFEAVEFARRSSHIVAQDIWEVQMKRGTRVGRHGDATCSKEAYDYLKSFPSHPPKYHVSNALSLCAVFTVKLGNDKGGIAHGMFGTGPGERLNRFSSDNFGPAEGLGGDGKFDHTCIFYVKFMIIDFMCGPARGHREGLMNKDGKHKYLGCYSDGKSAAFEMSSKAVLNKEYQRDYNSLGIYWRYDNHVVDHGKLLNDREDHQWSWF